MAKTYNIRDSLVVVHPSTSLTLDETVYWVWEVRNCPFWGKRMACSDLTVAPYAATDYNHERKNGYDDNNIATRDFEAGSRFPSVSSRNLSSSEKAKP